MSKTQATAVPEPWEAIVRATTARCERILLLVCVFTALSQVASFLGPRLWPKPPERIPLPIVVDRINGTAMAVNTLQELSQVDALEMQHKKHVREFVRARAGYIYPTLQRDFDIVRRMSTPAMFREYERQFDGDNGLDKRLGDREMHNVNPVLVRLTGTTPKGDREAVVTYDVTTRYADNKRSPFTQRYVATVHFKYELKAALDAVDREENPLAFVVTYFRADEETGQKEVAQ